MRTGLFMIRSLFLFTFLQLSLLNHLWASPAYLHFSDHIADFNAVSEDLKLILLEGDLPQDFISVKLEISKREKNEVTIRCPSNGMELRIKAGPTEWSSTLYYGLHRMGFLFPHPRVQISPKLTQMKSHCKKTYQWRPRLKYRGFHFHTLHPNEWMEGFLMGKTDIALDVVRWLARNNQNVMDLSLLRMDIDIVAKNLKAPFLLARNLGILRGVSAGFVTQQQKTYKIINMYPFLTKEKSIERLRKGLEMLIREIDFEFLILEMGTSEFTSSDYKQTIEWMNTAQKFLKEMKRQLFIKIHVSSNQSDQHYGNYNFLPKFADPDVGILPHTVFFYGLEDEIAPMYGNQDFYHIKEFMSQQSKVRPTWYYPESSYFIGLDIDVPLLLTDYLISRSADFDILDKLKVPGQINFTTGHENGYWLIDWTIALLSFSDYPKNPFIALELLGEDIKLWKRIAQFQTKYFKKLQLIQHVTSSNISDELPFLDKIHERDLLKELEANKKLAERDVNNLHQAIIEMPELEGVKNHELRSLLKVTWYRIYHAFYIRDALSRNLDTSFRRRSISFAKNYRLKALEEMSFISETYNRYPEANVFKKFVNPTSYQYGYGWPAKTLFFWEREEQVVLFGNFNPFYRNIYDLFRLIF